MKMLDNVASSCTNLISINISPHNTDINECITGTHLCTHNCTNSNGSYSCSCAIGYQLNIDGFQCDGK